MAPIKVLKISDVYSEHPNHPAENVLKCDLGNKWLCASSLDEMTSAVLQLETLTEVVSIDVHNENSAYIEISVAKSTDPDDFRVLLPKSELMSEKEAVTGEKSNCYKFFTKDTFNSGVRDEKWDLVKITIMQPFIFAQYGLCYVLFSDGEEVKLKQQPALVSITDRVSNHVCDGAVVSFWHVITNCYCLAKVIGNWHQLLDPYDFQVAAGMTNKKQLNEYHAQVRDISTMIVHPKCKKLAHGAMYDIGIIVVRRPFKLTDFVSPAYIAFYQEAHFYSELITPLIAKSGSCELVTWFASKKGETPVLQKQTVNIKDQSSCSREVPEIAKAYTCDYCYFCTTMSDKFGCTESLAGAPIFCDSFFTGVFKDIENCTSHHLYVFSRVDSSMEWIGYIISLGKTSRLTTSFLLVSINILFLYGKPVISS